MTGLWRSTLLLTVAATLGLLGLAISCDRPGLTADYYLHTADWQGDPIFSRHEHPSRVGWSHNRWEIRARVFSVRWTGWIWLDEARSYRFRVHSGARTTLSVDDRDLLTAGEETPRFTGPVELDRGLHSIALGYGRPTGGPRTFRIDLVSPDGLKQSLPELDLYADRPGPFRLLLRSWNLSLAQQRLLGILLMGCALAIGWTWSKPHQELIGSWRTRASSWCLGHGRWVRGAFFLSLFLLSFLCTLPFTGSPYGFDDVRYMDVAEFTRPVNWIVHRYAHIYLLKFFILLSGGSPFEGSELYWSFMFATTVTAMAVAMASLGKRLQIASLGVALGLLAAQPIFFLRIGAAYADYSAMMLVTLGVAIYLHGLSRSPGLSAAHVFLLGLCTLLAFKSKELGGVLMWLLPLLAFDEGRLHLGKFAKRAAWWSVGIASGLGSLMVLDAIFLGEPLFSIDLVGLAGSSDFNFAQFPQKPRTGGGWLDIIWQGHRFLNPGDASLGLLGLLVIAAAFVAARQGKRVELRLLHLMPLAYFAAVVLVHIRASYVHLPRYLFPMLPVSCVLAAKMFHDTGLDEIWNRLFRSRLILVTAFLTVAFMVLFLLPILGGSVWTYELLPWSWLAGFGWRSAEDFVQSTVAPVAILIGLSLLSLSLNRRVARPLLMLAVTAMLFAPYLDRNYEQLSTRKSVQRAQTYLYPFDTFEKVLRQRSARRLLLARSLPRDLMMCGPEATCLRIGKLYFGGGLRVRYASRPKPKPRARSFAIGTLEDLEKWTATRPGIPGRPLEDPSGTLFLVENSK